MCIRDSLKRMDGIKDQNNPLATYYNNMCTQSRDNSTYEFVKQVFLNLDIPKVMRSECESRFCTSNSHPYDSHVSDSRRHQLSGPSRHHASNSFCRHESDTEVTKCLENAIVQRIVLMIVPNSASICHHLQNQKIVFVVQQNP